MAEYEISVKTKEEVKKIITIMLDRKNASVSGEIFELSEENARELARSILNELEEGYVYYAVPHIEQCWNCPPASIWTYYNTCSPMSTLSTSTT